MPCLTNEEVTQFQMLASCNNYQGIVDFIAEINERACASCLGIVPAGTSVDDFLTVAVAPEGGLAFDPVNPDCDEIWVLEEDTDNRYVSLDDGLTWCQVCNGFCFAPETVSEGTAPEDILDEGWGDGSAGSGLDAIPSSANCSVLVALVGCDVCFAVNDPDNCDLGDGTAGTGTDWHCFSTAGGDVLLTFDGQLIAESPSLTSFNHTLQSNPNNFCSTPALDATANAFTLRSGTYQFRYDGSTIYSGGVPDDPVVDNGGIDVDVQLFNVTDNSVIDTATFHGYAVSSGEAVPSGLFWAGQFTIASAKSLRMRANFVRSSANLTDPLIPEAFGNLRFTKIG